MTNKSKTVAVKRSDDDISRKTLAVFVAIVVIVSVVGTWLILTNNVAVKSSDVVQGKVTLGVQEPPITKATEPVGGQVKLTILEQPN